MYSYNFIAFKVFKRGGNVKQRQQNSTNHPINFLMIDSTDHISGKTGLVTGGTLVVKLGKDGGSLVTAAGTVTEISNGWYVLAGNATDRNTVGELVINGTATGADPCDDKYEVVPWNPYDPICLGLTAFPSVAQGNNGSLALGNSSGNVTIATTSITSLVTAIWNEVMSTHTTSGTYGAYIPTIPTTTAPTLSAIAATILVTPANKLATDSSGFVSTNNIVLPTDYQQRGVAVTLPSTPPTGYGGSTGSSITTADITAALLVNPNNKILSNSDGSVLANIGNAYPHLTPEDIYNIK